MKNPISHILTWLRVCAICGAWQPPTVWICRTCQKIWRERTHSNRGHVWVREDLTGLALAVWRKDDGFPRELIYSCKEQKGLQAWPELAWQMTRARMHLGSYDQIMAASHAQKLIFCSAPRQGKQDDHASLFAKQLAQIWKGRYLNLFRPRSGVRQKYLNRADRLLQTVEMQPGVVIDENMVVIFIDDVVATGSTARGCYLALGRPRHFEPWVVLDRCEDNSDQKNLTTEFTG